MTHTHTRLQQAMTISGDRATGKTYMALLYAVAEAHLGKRVLWQTAGAEYAAYALREARDLATSLGLPWSRATNLNGGWALRFESDGLIHFRPPIRKAILDHYDLQVLEDPEHWGGAALPNVPRVVKTICTNPLDNGVDEQPTMGVIQKNGRMYYFEESDITEVRDGIKIRPRGVGAGTPDGTTHFKVWMS